MKTIALTNSQELMFVDDDLFDVLTQYNWRLSQSRGLNYAATGAHQEPYNNRQFAHALVLGKAPEGLVIDPIDRNGLNNQRNNLRFATLSQNKANGRLYKNNPSGYRGVVFRKERLRWKAQIRVNNKLIYIGTFTEVEEAARAYDKVAKEHFGEFAYQNFP